MSNHCKIEFYFKRKDLEKLLADNPTAKGVIIKQEIKPRRNAGTSSFINLTSISAYTIHNDDGKDRSVEEITEVPGCPYPPGCGEEEEEDVS